MEPKRLREMMLTGSPGLIDHALRQALTHLELEKPRARARSPYAIPHLVAGLANKDRLIDRAVQIQLGR